MKLYEYQDWVVKRAKQPIDMDGGTYNFIGLAGETGEVLEWLKKSKYRGNPAFTEEMLKSELGDVLHYVTRIGLYYGWGLKDIINYNVEKLEARNGK